MEFMSDDKPTITISKEFGWIPKGEFSIYDTRGNLRGEFEVDEKKSDTEFTIRPSWPEMLEPNTKESSDPPTSDLAEKLKQAFLKRRRCLVQGAIE